MLVVGILGAFIFARQMTNPIKRLANDTKKMAKLVAVSHLPKRNDEIGSLACDVHSMYNKLKETISKLEDEILRVREMEESQRYFFSAASHELKTPIAATSVLLEGMLENVGDYKDHPKYIKECINLMDAQTKIIYEILEIVNLNDGKIIPSPEKIDIGCMVADMLPNYQTLAEAEGKRIVCDITDGETTLADPKMLKKALANVLLNAVQNTPKDGEIRIWTEAVADQYRLCVLNAGAKIDNAVLPKLFDPFYRVDKARSRKDGRSGLGLTIVQKALEAMEIAYSLENVKDGVLFWMDLPEI
jgi:two-component system sensor histidine kinase VanS